MSATDGLIKTLKRSSEDLVKILGDEFVGMVLFGSWTRGEAKEDSDIDVFIVFRSLKGFDVRARVYSVIAEHVKKPLTLVDARLSEIAGKDYELPPLMINILYDGIIIWDRDGALKSLIEAGRRLVKEAGLVRYRTPDGKYGWRRADGKPMATSGLC